MRWRRKKKVETEPPVISPEELTRLTELLKKFGDSFVPKLEADLAAQSKRFEAVGERMSPSPGKEIRFDEPWKSWIASLPEEARDDGTQACLNWHEMIVLRNRLREVIEEHASLSGVLYEEARSVMEVRMWKLRSMIQRTDQVYVRFAEPFFEIHGRPPLGDTVLASNKPLRRAAPSDVRVGQRPFFLERRIRAPLELHWEAWQRTLPDDHRSEALRVQVLYDDLAELRERLASAVEGVREGNDAARAQIEELKPHLIRADQEYRCLAEPLFEKYGKPELGK